jgi:peptidoglycan hydrolase CwlO-like protein
VLVEEQGRLKHEKSVLARNIVGYEKEIADLKSKFEVDRKRWVQLKAGKGDASVEAEAKPIEAKADAKVDAKAAAAKAAPKKN